MDSAASLKLRQIQTLVVEDDTHFQQALVRVLAQRFFHDVTYVSTADAALTHLNRIRYDLVISDFMLPGKMNGLQLYQYCRKKFGSLPFLLISGAHDGELQALIKDEKAGPRFLSKPFQPNEFVESVCAELEKHKTKKRAV